MRLSIGSYISTVNKNHSICNFDMKDSLIYRDLLTQLSRNFPLSDLPIVLLGENMFLRLYFIWANICFFLKFLTSFFDNESYMRPMVSYIPPSSFIFLAMSSVCLSKYYWVFGVLEELPVFGC